MKIEDYKERNAARRQATKAAKVTRLPKGRRVTNLGLGFQDQGVLGTEALEELWQRVAPCLNGKKFTLDLPGKPGGFARATLVPLNQGVQNVILCRANGRHETVSLTVSGQLSGIKLLGAMTHDAVRGAVVRGLATALGVAN